MEDLDLTAIEEALCTWILQTARYNDTVAVTYTTALVKANFFKIKCNLGNGFYPSRSWIDDFKQRYKVFIITAPRNSSQRVPRIQFLPSFMSVINRASLCPSQVYIADEAGLYWRFLSSSMEPDLLTFLTCTNVTGQHKLQPLVIGKTRNPKILRNIDLPIHYYSQKNAWITRELFKKWFHECFVAEVKDWLRKQSLPQQALLLVDSAACHPAPGILMSADSDITVLLMPPQIEQEEKWRGIYDFMKRKYKNSILRSATSPYGDVDILTKFNLRDMSFLLSDCWNSVPTDMILACWHSFNFTDTWMPFDKIVETWNENETTASIQQLCGHFGFELEKMTTWYEGADEDKNGSHFMSDDEIAESSLTIMLDGDEDVEEVVPESAQSMSRLSPEEAFKGFELCIRWAEENGYSCNEISMLRSMKDKVLKFPDFEPPPKRIKLEQIDTNRIKEIKTELETDEEFYIKEEIITSD